MDFTRCQHLDVSPTGGVILHGHLVRIGDVEHALCHQCYLALLAVLGGTRQGQEPLLEPGSGAEAWMELMRAAR